MASMTMLGLQGPWYSCVPMYFIDNNGVVQLRGGLPGRLTGPYCTLLYILDTDTLFNGIRLLPSCTAPLDGCMWEDRAVLHRNYR